jgi:hypothetical protein
MGAWQRLPIKWSRIGSQRGLIPFRGDDGMVYLRVDRELEPFGGEVNKNHFHNPLDPLASDGFTCKEASKHLLECPFKPVQHPLDFE